MALGVERLDRGKAAGHRDSRRVRPRRPARDRPTDRLAQLVALRFVLHDATRPAHAFGGVNTLAARQDPCKGCSCIGSSAPIRPLTAVNLFRIYRCLTASPIRVTISLQYRRRRREIQPREPRVIARQTFRRNSARPWPDPGRTARPGTAVPAPGNRARPDTSPPAPASSRPEARRRASCASQSRFARNCARISSSHGCPSSQAATVASTPVTPGEPSNRDGMRLRKPLLQRGRAKMHDGAAQRREC